MRPRLLDLFCGAGGASTGLAAFGDLVGFDIDADACAAHQINGHHTVRCDLNKWPWRGTCDLLWASPPCQPFSSAGDRKGTEDSRDGIPAFLRAVDELRPPIVVMENVPGLTNKKHLTYRGMFTTALLRMGYDYQSRILNCADYGVPQTRERFILIARCDGGRIRWPQRTHSQAGIGVERWVSMADALGWGMTVRPYLTIASSRTTGGPDKEKVGGSGARAQLYAEQAAGRWHFARPSTTIAADSRVQPPGHKRNSGDPPGKYEGRAGENAIRITVEQAATLQGFPLGYRFVGSKTSQFQQIGNAVPPALARLVVEALL